MYSVTNKKEESFGRGKGVIKLLRGQHQSVNAQVRCRRALRHLARSSTNKKTRWKKDNKPVQPGIFKVRARREENLIKKEMWR